MIALLQYHKRIYIKSYKWIIPSLIWALFTYSMYTGSYDISFVSNMVLSGGLLFIIMAFVGYSYMDMEDIVTEQLITLKVKNTTYYNLSKIVFVKICGLFMSAIGIVYPLILNVIKGLSLFDKKITIEDIVYAFIFLYTISFLGAMLGVVFHPRVIKNRAVALPLLSVIIIIAFVKDTIMRDIPVSGFFLWLSPPICNILSEFKDESYYSLSTILLVYSYGLILAIIQLHFLRKNKFS